VPDGEFGELVFTSLTKEALPIVRYRTRDLTRVLPGTARTMRRIEKITGRSDDMLIIRGVNVFPSQIEELILRQNRLAPHYVLEVTRPDKLDEIAVLVEPRPEFATMNTQDRQEVTAALNHAIKTYVGISAEVRLTAIGGIERSIGKAKRVLDKRPR
jgi:phenylacetate-CoA ligase